MGSYCDRLDMITPTARITAIAALAAAIIGCSAKSVWETQRFKAARINRKAHASLKWSSNQRRSMEVSSLQLDCDVRLAQIKWDYAPMARIF